MGIVVYRYHFYLQVDDQNEQAIMIAVTTTEGSDTSLTETMVNFFYCCVFQIMELKNMEKHNKGSTLCQVSEQTNTLVCKHFLSSAIL